MNKRQRGFTLIEVLVVLVIVSVGMLGIAGLQARAQQAELESYQRAQALVLLQDMVNRLNSNREAAGCYPQASEFGASTDPTFTCTAFGNSASQGVAVDDLEAWDGLLDGAAQTTGGQEVGAMINAHGCITYDSVNDIYTITVVWQGLVPTAAPTNTCGQAQFTDQKKRRLVEATVQFADLN